MPNACTYAKYLGRRGGLKKTEKKTAAAKENWKKAYAGILRWREQKKLLKANQAAEITQPKNEPPHTS